MILRLNRKNITESISKDYRTKVNDEVHASIGATFPVNKMATNMDTNRSFYKIFIILLCLVICDIAYPSVPSDIVKEINRAQKNVFELIVDKNNSKKPITLRFLSDKAEICKLNLEFFSQIKFYITELDNGKEEHIFACNSFSNKAVQPTSKLESLTVSKDTFYIIKSSQNNFWIFLKM